MSKQANKAKVIAIDSIRKKKEKRASERKLRLSAFTFLKARLYAFHDLFEAEGESSAE